MQPRPAGYTKKTGEPSLCLIKAIKKNINGPKKTVQKLQETNQMLVYPSNFSAVNYLRLSKPTQKLTQIYLHHI